MWERMPGTAERSSDHALGMKPAPRSNATRVCGGGAPAAGQPLNEPCEPFPHFQRVRFSRSRTSCPSRGCRCASRRIGGARRGAPGQAHVSARVCAPCGVAINELSPVTLTKRFLAFCEQHGLQRLAVRLVSPTAGPLARDPWARSVVVVPRFRAEAVPAEHVRVRVDDLKDLVFGRVRAALVAPVERVRADAAVRRESPAHAMTCTCS